VGTGRIGRRILGLLADDARFETHRCNRTVCAEDQGRVRPLTELSGVLAGVDAAVVATGALETVVTAGHLAARPPDSPMLLVDIGIPEQVERSGLPRGTEVAGLDELTEFYRSEFAPDRGHTRREEAGRLVDRAISEFRAFCNERAFSGILDTIQRHHRQLVGEEIPRLIAERFAYLPGEIRGRLEEDLRGIVLEYTSEVFRTIKDTTRREAEDEG
jgi:glutamyl-tRNA reductase